MARRQRFPGELTWESGRNEQGANTFAPLAARLVGAVRHPTRVGVSGGQRRDPLRLRRKPGPISLPESHFSVATVGAVCRRFPVVGVIATTAPIACTRGMWMTARLATAPAGAPR